MKVFPLLVGVLIHLAAAATFEGKEDDYAKFMEDAKKGRGGTIGKNMRELATKNSGNVIADTGVGEGRYWRHNPETGNVDDVTEAMAHLSPEDNDKLEEVKKKWAEEEAKRETPEFTDKEKKRARGVIEEWEKPGRLGKRDTVLTLRGKEITKEMYTDLKAEVENEFGPIGDTTDLSVRDTDSADFFPPFLIVLLGLAFLLPVIILAAIAVLWVGLAIATAVGGIIYVVKVMKGIAKIAVGVAAGVAGHRGHRNKPPGLIDRAPTEGTVWETGDDASVPIVSMNELVATPTGTATALMA